MVSQNLYINHNAGRMQQPVTAAVDGAANRFSQQQAMNAFNPLYSPAVAQNQLQAMQLQMMQMEIARLQTLQAQQYQAELFAAQAQAAAQRQRQVQQATRRTPGFAPPATAGPTNTGFDLRTATIQAQLRRSNQDLRSKLGVGADDHIPMTAALGGKFGSRMASGKYDSDDDDFASTGAKQPSTPNYTTVISGGTSLGSPASNNINGAAPSKSDTAVSWRRAPVNNSMLNVNRAASSPMVKVTPPPGERVSPPPGLAPKARPQPLRFTSETSQSMVSAIAVDSDGGEADDGSSVSSKSNSSPSTPHTASSVGDVPLSPREEASKKLYEGLGLGRQIPTISVAVPQDSTVVVQRLVSLPVRQPRGPPSNNDELVPKNFATRSRRKAIGALLDARERREVEAF
ncbi:hypothetical protein A0H81_03545 [Grifola frondosa]|uniref:Uncharacterized protein n=1 Tax=Grifola frondosa TaxID=5627 RepID=A0A1C7MJV3_GRIFR|nr:hypothetical protein A0H81_03545 [Grifola frondosa]